MIALALTILVAQAVAMAVDELHFHRGRRLPRWERIGHPLDTATVLACYVVALVSPPTPAAMTTYAGAALFSCLFVTKDEAVHAGACAAGEHWLHAVLFVLHPLVLGAMALLWWRGERGLLEVQAGLTVVFGVYQVVYWNGPWTRARDAR